VSRRAVVTGAFSYTGSAVAGALLSRGWSVHTLTSRRPPEGETRITSAPLRFDLDHLARELAGADVLVSTSWVRMPWKGMTFATAAERAAVLVQAAKEAGVPRIVQVTVSNAERASNLGYYAGKARVEAAVRSSGVSYAIVRPTLVVGREDVLTNNIAWLLRRFPVFLVPEGGAYRLQPITLEDHAEIIAGAVVGPSGLELDAAGPEIFTFAEYLRVLAGACGLRRVFLPAPNRLVLAALAALGAVLGDVVLTREELLGLQQEALLSHEPPRGRTSVRAWLMRNGPELGRRYVNDRYRHFGAGAGTPIHGIPPSPPGA
jgi:NADH dehydrogenase